MILQRGTEALARISPALLFAVLLLLATVEGWGADSRPAAPPPGPPRAEILRLGERMYREGILPSGAPLPAFIRGDVEVDSSAFSCSSCHLRAGLGSFEGGVVTPPTTGAKLYKPYRRPPSMGDVTDQAGRYIYAKTVLERPAYSRQGLADSLRYGIDPAGQVFNDVMPHYPLEPGDMSILISYLEALSAEPSPGASDAELKFATIITDDVSPEDRQALLEPLRKFIDHNNQQAELYYKFRKFGYSPTIDMTYAFRRTSLEVWELKGPPDSWQAQLAGYYRRTPVFAVLSGMSNGDWRPIHDFCEAQRLPCLYPITDFPAVSESGWYTYYFNKGYAQEGGAVASYIDRREAAPAEGPIIQVVQDSPAGRALANGFQSRWSEQGRAPVTTLTLPATELLDPAALRGILKKHRPGVLLLWTDANLLPQLPALVAGLPDPAMVFLSSGYLGKKTATIAESVRDRVYLSYPYRLTPYVGSKNGGFNAKVPLLASARDLGERRITSRVATMLKQSTLRALNLLYDNLHRDHLLDIMSTQMDLTVQDYERLSFGPGQRYASKGCYVIQLGPGAAPALLPRNEWVAH